MKWQTRISVHKNGKLYVRGKDIVKLASKSSFSDLVFLMLRGSLPSKKERAMLDVMLVLSVEHGVNVPSAFVPRTVSSTGNSVNASLAAGILAVGDWHGGAIESAAKLCQTKKNTKDLVQEMLREGKHMPGYGHKIYKDKDPRSEMIFKKAKQLGFSGAYVTKAKDVERELKHATKKHLPINIDGAIAAVVSGLGFDWRLGKAIFALGRFPGMIAHIYEEMVHEKPYRRLDDDDVQYIGPTIR